MELVINRGQAITRDGAKPYYAVGVRLDLGAKQADIIGIALRMAIKKIESDPHNSSLIRDDIILLQDAIDQVAEARVHLTNYFEQTRYR